MTPHISSFGDLARLGIFESFRPSRDDVISVDDVLFSVRTRICAIITYIYQYDDQLRVGGAMNGRFITEEDLKRYFGILEEWVEAVV